MSEEHYEHLRRLYDEIDRLHAALEEAVDDTCECGHPKAEHLDGYRFCIAHYAMCDCERFEVWHEYDRLLGRERVEREALARALRRYGKHDPECWERMRLAVGVEVLCTCGLDSALWREFEDDDGIAEAAEAASEDG